MKEEPNNEYLDDEIRTNLPQGIKLVRVLRGHKNTINCIAWSPDGDSIASQSRDKTLRIWQLKSDETYTLRTEMFSRFAWAPDGANIAYSDNGNILKIWDTHAGQLVGSAIKFPEPIDGVKWSPKGTQIACSSCGRKTDLDAAGIWIVTFPDRKLTKLKVALTGVNIDWSPDGSRIANAGCNPDSNVMEIVNILKSGAVLINPKTQRHTWQNCFDVKWAPDSSMIATGSQRGTVDIWSPKSGQLIRQLEGHTSSRIRSVSFTADRRFLVSAAGDTNLIVWRCDRWQKCIEIPLDPGTDGLHVLDCHPTLPLIAAADNQSILIFKLIPSVLLNQPTELSTHYVNAKVILVGDTGVGKTGLSLVLNGQTYKETDSTAGRHVWTFDSQEIPIGDNINQTCETLLWDLAGQPGYRVIHQLHLNEVAVALVVFDARSETDPLAGVRHWERALRLAEQRQGIAGMPMKKFLVSARNDRGGVSISEERVQKILEEFGFDGYFKTSAKEGWQIKELRTAIEQSINWGKLPKVSSSQLFAEIKSFLLEIKKTGLLLTPVNQLYEEFVQKHKDANEKVQNLRNQFETCIGRLENRDLIRRLTFGDYVLLQPEMLDAYASAMVNSAKEEPDGLGSIAEEIALAGKFFVPPEQKIEDSGQEQLLLYATVEELVRHDLALRENADDGRYLVFPSQFNRDYEDAPEPKGKVAAITFEGPVQSLYATLAVRLGHSGLFTTRRIEMWRNAAVFTAKAGGKCGLFLHEFAEGRGRLILFFPDEHTTAETRFHFEEFVLSHAKQRALEGTVELVRFFVCPDCNDPVPDSYVKRLIEKGKTTFTCPCGGMVSLSAPKERVHFKSKVEEMDESADQQQKFDSFVISAKGETSTAGFLKWVGGERATLAIVFTDIIGSTALGEEIGDEAMNEVRRTHFAQSRKLIDQFNGREIKTIGDSFMAAFRCVDAALDYALALQEKTGHPQVQIRAGIHIGPIQVEEGDVFGGTVNFAARVIVAIKNAEIWLSDRAKEDIDRLGAKKYKHLQWEKHESIVMKGFSGSFTLWSIKK